MKTYTIDDFKPESVYTYSEGTLSCAWNEPKWWDINDSSILTKLIQEAGRWCENYASDLFIDWQTIDQKLKDPEYTGGKYLFGFREMGVDHAPYILSHFNRNGHSEYYRSIWCLEITVEDQNMKMQLGRVRM